MKNIRILLCTALALLLLSGCDKQPQTLVKRVIFPGDYPDPSIVRDGNDFYMTSSSMTYYPGLLVWHSTDLRNWEPISFGVTAEQDYFGNLARQIDASRPQNRLTAMGLGSGNSEDSIAKDHLDVARAIAKDLHLALAAIREQNYAHAATAVYAP